MKMALLSSHFIILQAIFQNILYIHQPYNSKEVFACFDKNGQRNDSWPSNWIRMSPYVVNNVPTFITSISNDTIQYKLRIRFQDGTTGDVDWKKLIDACATRSTPFPPSAVISKECMSESVSGLLYYITVCSSLLIIKCILKIIQKKFSIETN